MTPKQLRFIEEYLIDLNATQAASRAGYSRRTAHSQGQRLLKNVEVAARIAERRAEIVQKLRIDQEWCRRLLVSLVEYGMQMEELVQRVRGTSKEGDHITRIRMRDPELARKALEFLGRDCGMCSGEPQQQRPAILVIQEP